MIRTVFIPKLNQLYKFVQPLKVDVRIINGVGYGNIRIQNLNHIGLSVIHDNNIDEVIIPSCVVFKLLSINIRSDKVKLGVYKKFNANQIGTFVFYLRLSYLDGLQLEEA